jgi:hypothetical protein
MGDLAAMTHFNTYPVRRSKMLEQLGHPYKIALIYLYHYAVGNSCMANQELMLRVRCTTSFVMGSNRDGYLKTMPTGTYEREKST